LFSGTLSDAGRLLVEGSGGNGVLDGDVAADGTLLNASGGIFGQRCQCDDGNLASGDGCSADCQLEPCWTCSGSSCEPAGDGTPCTAGACIDGATCSGGVCTGGMPVLACIDLTGIWTIDAVTTLFGQSLESVSAREIEQ